MDAKLRSIAVVLALLACLIAISHAQTPIDLKGQVVGSKGDAKQFVSVSLEGPGRYSAMTNAEGNFTIRRVLPGKYSIRVRRGNRITAFVGKNISTGKIQLKVGW